MVNESSQPNPGDAVLGGQNLPPIYAAVLGGIAGVKYRLAALSKALRYEEAQDLLLQTLKHSSETVQWAAY